VKLRVFVAALLTAAVLFICATGFAVAAPALWIVQSHAGKIYLFGTVHMLRDGILWRTPEMEAAIGESQDLYLEIADPMNSSTAIASILKIGFDREHPLSSKISKHDVALLDEAAKNDGLGSEATFEPMQPWLVYMIVSTLPAVHSGYRPGNGVDIQLRQQFVAAGKPVYGFETIAQQAHIFADLSQAAQVTLLDTELKDMGQPANVSELDDIVNVWLTGNEDKLASMLLPQTQTTLDRRLLSDRNEAWANALAERLKHPGTSFVSVGAAHLAGPDGVPALLGRMGFTVTRVQTSEPAATATPASPNATQAAPSTAPTATPSPAASATPIPQTLTPPAGWKPLAKSYAVGGFKTDRMWIDSNHRGIIIAGHLDLPGISANDLDALDSLFHQGLVEGAGAKSQVQPSTRVRICNGTQDATYTKIKLSTVAEDIVLTVSDRGYLANYVRRRDIPDDPAAIRSILSLCAP
jgi:uncharacterized protein YbaP (TraB family)